MIIRPMSSKADVRKLIRALPPLSVHERAESSRRICEMVRADPGWATARVIAFFAPQTTEPDVELLWEDLEARIACYPRVEKGGLAFFPVTERNLLIAGRWDLREPAGDAAHALDVAEINLVLVPGVAFTRGGVRMGRGGGYYDRFLAQPNLRARKLGVCFMKQLVETLPVESHDQPVDRVIAA